MARMRRIVIKTVFFLLITTALLWDYRLVTIHNSRLMLSNFDKRDTWSEVYQIVPAVTKAEVYDPIGNNTRGDETFDFNLVLYTHANLYNVRATDNDLERVGQLLANERIRIESHDPVELWFYGLLYMLVIIFPIMRTADTYDNQTQGDKNDG